MRTTPNTPTSPAAGHLPTFALQKPRLYRWRLSAPGKNRRLHLQIIAHTPAEAKRIFSRFYPGLAVVANGRFVI